MAAWIACVLPLLCVFSSEVPVVVRVTVVLVSSIAALRFLRNVRASQARSLLIDPEGESWLLVQERKSSIEILPGVLDMGWLVLVSWRVLETGKVDRAALARDAYDAKTWRGVRCWARWGAPTASV